MFCIHLREREEKDSAKKILCEHLTDQDPSLKDKNTKDRTEISKAAPMKPKKMRLLIYHSYSNVYKCKLCRVCLIQKKRKKYANIDSVENKNG